MNCCGKGADNDNENEPCIEAAVELEQICHREQAKCQDKDSPYTWYPTVKNIQQIDYVRRLEKQYQSLQSCYLNLSSQMARLQFRVRQIVQADPSDRERLFKDLERMVFQENDVANQCYPEELPSLEQHERDMGDIKKKQHMLIHILRKQIGSFQEASESLATEYHYDDTDWSKDQELEIIALEKNKSQKSLVKTNSTISQSKPQTSVKASDSKIRKSGGYDCSISATTTSRETCSSSFTEHEPSVRSTSFKELREMYQKGCSRNS